MCHLLSQCVRQTLSGRNPTLLWKQSPKTAKLFTNCSLESGASTHGTLRQGPPNTLRRGWSEASSAMKWLPREALGPLRGRLRAPAAKRLKMPCKANQNNCRPRDIMPVSSALVESNQVHKRTANLQRYVLLRRHAGLGSAGDPSIPPPTFACKTQHP